MHSVLQRRGFLYGKVTGDMVESGVLDVAPAVKATTWVFFAKV